MSTLAMLAAHSPPRADPDSPLALYRKSEERYDDEELDFEVISVNSSRSRASEKASEASYDVREERPMTPMERIEEISPNSTRRIYSPCEDPDVAVELERPMGPQRQLVWRDETDAPGLLARPGTPEPAPQASRRVTMSPVSAPRTATAAPPSPPASATRTERSLRRGSSLAALLDEPEAPPAEAPPTDEAPEPEAPKPLAVADLRSLGRPTIADPASVANDPGQARAGTPDVWDLLQDGDVLEFHGDDDSLGDDYEEAADAYDDAVDGVLEADGDQYVMPDPPVEPLSPTTKSPLVSGFSSPSRWRHRAPSDDNISLEAPESLEEAPLPLLNDVAVDVAGEEALDVLDVQDGAYELPEPPLVSAPPVTAAAVTVKALGAPTPASKPQAPVVLKAAASPRAPSPSSPAGRRSPPAPKLAVVPPAPTPQAETGERYAVCNRTVDAIGRRYADGFHSSATDPLLRAKYGNAKADYGHLPPPPTFGAPPPPATVVTPQTSKLAAFMAAVPPRPPVAAAAPARPPPTPPRLAAFVAAVPSPTKPLPLAAAAPRPTSQLADFVAAVPSKPETSEPDPTSPRSPRSPRSPVAPTAVRLPARHSPASTDPDTIGYPLSDKSLTPPRADDGAAPSSKRVEPPTPATPPRRVSPSDFTPTLLREAPRNLESPVATPPRPTDDARDLDEMEARLALSPGNVDELDFRPDRVARTPPRRRKDRALRRRARAAPTIAAAPGLSLMSAVATVAVGVIVGAFAGSLRAPTPAVHEWVASLEAIPTDGYLDLLPALEPSHWGRGPTPVGFVATTRLSPYSGERVAAVPEATAFPDA